MDFDGETGTGMPGVMPASMSQSLDINSISQNPLDPSNKMTASMTGSTTSLSNKSRRVTGHRNATSQNWFCFDEDTGTEGRAELAMKEREREDRIRRIKEQQEEDRRKKLVELKQHAMSAQKFREQQENERRQHIENRRTWDMDRRAQVEERRREIERTEQERREAILSKNKERDQRLAERRSSRGNIEFAFGSSAPRMAEQRDSAYWGSRSVYERRSAERELEMKGKRTSSAQGLDRSHEGDENGLWPSSSASYGAHRRRTDLIPTILMGRDTRGSVPTTPGKSVSLSRIDHLAQPRQPTAGGLSMSGASKSMSHLAHQRTAAQPRTKTKHQRAQTAGAPLKKQGLSRENSTASRPGSAMSGGGRGAVRLRSAPGRRPRPLSIATTGLTASNGGMTASMYEERQKPPLRNKSLATPKFDRMKRARSVTGENNLDDDQRSNVSSASSGPINSGSQPIRATNARKTPAQVKAEAAARRAKSNRSQPATPKTSLGRGGSTPVSPALSTDQLEHDDDNRNADNKRQITPDIIKDNNKKEFDNEQKEVEKVDEKVAEKVEDKEEKKEEEQEKEDKPEKKIINSEEEAKARIAEKRREMKEKKEREEEAERLRLEEEERVEAERLRAEEEEERRVMEETEKIAGEARKAEDERIKKAIEENEAEERRVKEEEERAKKEKEEADRKSKEEAEKREADLQEKLKKEEEERQARKKRIEEIMARTRGKGGAGTPTSTPKKEHPETKTEDSPPEEDASQKTSQPQSLDTNVDPTKPDLLGDISDSVHTENARNLQNGAETQNGANIQNGVHANGEVEKGALDSISNKSEENSQASIKLSPIQSPLIEMESGSSKMSVLENDFDQILDLSGDNRRLDEDAPPAPIIAFEQSSQQTDLLS